MAITQMVRNVDSLNHGASVYNTKMSLTSGTYSDTYIIPREEIVAIGGFQTGSGAVEFTVSSEDDITNSIATFESWDGLAQINKAVTGFRLRRDSGTVTATITIKTRNQ